jgi:hypothetical protein
MLFGYGLYPGNGMLVDLTDILPIWFLMIRPKRRRRWVIRPPYEKGTLANITTVGL